jgi:hypothetical protein
MKKFLIVFMGLISSLVLAQSYRLEPEEMPDLNQWKISTSKEASQGKLVYSTKKDKNEIECVVELPEAGDYYLWVRSISYGQNYRKTG